LDEEETRKGGGLATETPANRLATDLSHFDEFYRCYFLPLVRRATWKYHLEKEDARDVVQEAFLVALAKLDPKRNPKAWLIQVVDHLSANFQRKTLRRAKLACKWSAGESRLVSLNQSIEQIDHYDGAENIGDLDD
jgi:DNA-directed RNA polymerase specialized sigma24 family protein